MAALPEALERSALTCAEENYDDVELAAGQLECREFELSRSAFDCRFPQSEARMITAFKRFHQLGFEAFFQGATAIPMAIACRPQLASMWADGFVAARMWALAKRCDCDCSRTYRWGHGYDVCPRRTLALAQRSIKLVTALSA